MNNATDVRVMILDDEPFMLQLLERMLVNLGVAQTVLIDSAGAALAWIDGHPQAPELILCDLNMPEMDGIEFIRQLVERHYGGSLILVSGEDERMLQSAEKLLQAHRLNILGHLNKPVAPKALAELIDKWLRPAAAAPQVARKRYGAEEIRAAIAQGQLVNYYQPKVAVTDGRLAGVETLVRWQHPRDGLVLPDQFIHTAEEHGLIDPLTQVVLFAAFAQAKAWRDAGLDLSIAVNLSMDNLRSLDFPDFVAHQAAAAGIASKHIVLEITESRLMQDVRAPLEILTRLSLKRFSLSIDDFGTGHSSMAQLRDIPFDQLKIDQSFVHGAHTNETIRAIYDASAGLARQLGMEIVAEGVEDQDDWNFVRDAGCDLAQGYYISRPMPAEKLAEWQEDWQRRIKG
jgi:EAL domain-containing protein (putative c-di-GMP-specific phosphodiesterase class I)/FixJ family two-component response regulator